MGRPRRQRLEPGDPERRDRPHAVTHRSAGGTNVYSRAGAGMLDDVARRAKPLVYVPDHTSDRVDVIDPRTYKVVERFPVPAGPQHVVPSWDLKTLWVNDNTGNKLTPIDPTHGQARAGPSPSPTPTTSTSPPTASTPSSWPRHWSASTSGTPAR